MTKLYMTFAKTCILLAQILPHTLMTEIHNSSSKPTYRVSWSHTPYSCFLVISLAHPGSNGVSVVLF